MFSWLFRRRPVPVVQEAKAGHRYTHLGHDESKGREAFQKSRAEALAIRAARGEPGPSDVGETMKRYECVDCKKQHRARDPHRFRCRRCLNRMVKGEGNRPMNENIEAQLSRLRLEMIGDDPVFVQRHRCPCCEFKTLDAKGQYNICDICYWEDEYRSDEEPYASEVSAPNGLTLHEARVAYRRWGASTLAMLRHVRTPRPYELTEREQFHLNGRSDVVGLTEKGRQRE